MAHLGAFVGSQAGRRGLSTPRRRDSSKSRITRPPASLSRLWVHADVELLHYLEAHGFANYIVSGGNRDFMRAISGTSTGCRATGSWAAPLALRTEKGEAA